MNPASSLLIDGDFRAHAWSVVHSDLKVGGEGVNDVLFGERSWH